MNADMLRRVRPPRGLRAALCLALATLCGNARPDDATPPAAEIQATIGALESAVATLETRIARLRDVEELENLHAIYGYYLDKALWDPLVEIFAENATVEIAQRGVYVGKKRIREALELFGPQVLRSAHLHNHIQLQPVIHVAADGQSAKMRARAFSQLGTHGQRGVWMGGVYENEFVKENGVWKISKDHVYTTFSALYDKGWSNEPRPAPGISDKIPPDRPPTEIYQAFPGAYVPPYHYPHPVRER
jgi:hypothetical protein